MNSPLTRLWLTISYSDCWNQHGMTWFKPDLIRTIISFMYNWLRTEYVLWYGFQMKAESKLHRECALLPYGKSSVKWSELVFLCTFKFWMYSDILKVSHSNFWCGRYTHTKCVTAHCFQSLVTTVLRNESSSANVRYVSGGSGDFV